MRLLFHWLLSALSLLLVSHFVPGFHVSGIYAALIAAVFIGLVNGTLGMLLKIITLPLGLLSFGIFFLVVNALMLELVSSFLKGFTIEGFWPAFWGACILALLNMLVRSVMKQDRPSQE